MMYSKLISSANSRKRLFEDFMSGRLTLKRLKSLANVPNEYRKPKSEAAEPRDDDIIISSSTSIMNIAAKNKIKRTNIASLSNELKTLKLGEHSEEFSETIQLLEDARVRKSRVDYFTKISRELCLLSLIMKGDLTYAKAVYIKASYVMNLNKYIAFAYFFEAHENGDSELLTFKQTYYKSSFLSSRGHIQKMAHLLSHFNRHNNLKEFPDNLENTSELKKYLSRFKHYDCFLPKYARIFKRMCDKYEIDCAEFIDQRLTKIENVPLIAKHVYDADENNQKQEYYRDKVPIETLLKHHSLASSRPDKSTYNFYETFEPHPEISQCVVDKDKTEKLNKIFDRWENQLSSFLKSCFKDEMRSGENKMRNLSKPKFCDLFNENECEFISKFLMRNVIIESMFNEGGLSSVMKKYLIESEVRNFTLSPRELWSKITYEHYGMIPYVPHLIISNFTKLHISQKISNFIFTHLFDNNGNKAFQTGIRTLEKGIEYVYFGPNNHLSELYDEVFRTKVFCPIYKLPRTLPAIPFISLAQGNDIQVHKSLILRLNDVTIRHIVQERCLDHRMAPILDTLSCLGSVGWRVNEKVLDVVIKHVKTKKQFNQLKLPTYTVRLSMADSFSLASSRLGVAHPRFSEIMTKSHEYREENFKEFNEWIMFVRTISLFSHYRDKVFYFPHLLDFRGRAYPDSILINHYSTDLIRSMLVFAKKKTVGERGLYWLKIHLVNIFGGMGNYTFDQRIKFVDSNIDNITKVAEDPFKNTWWHAAKKPWQALATCIEINNALKDPNYKSSFPIHQDGTCNGLQHYAALGRNEEGAKSVNLTPRDCPSDVYSDIAKIINEKISKDPVISSILNNESIISRDVVKTPVMTFVYGVSEYGARQQIEKKLKKLNCLNNNEIATCSAFISDQIFAALEHLFTSAKHLMDWFSLFGETVSKRGKQVIWETPLGLVCQQDYSAYVDDSLLKNNNSSPDIRKHRAATAPNFIHSLDACHMMLSCLEANRKGISFASVHDSYWTHPCDTDILNEIIRDKFVRLHSFDILNKFKETMKIYADMKDLPPILDIPLPKGTFLIFLINNTLGNFDLDAIKKSKYFFS